MPTGMVRSLLELLNVSLELGPAGGEAEDARGEQAGQRLRQDDRPDGRRRAGASTIRPVFLHLLRDPEEVVTQISDGKRKVESRCRGE